MKVFYRVILAILVLLAVSSGVAKVMLAEQEVGFFAKFGISEQTLIAFGATQLLGGFLMLPRVSRFAGAFIVAVTFFLSLAMLLLDGNVLISGVNVIALLLLCYIMWQSARRKSS